MHKSKLLLELPSLLLRGDKPVVRLCFSPTPCCSVRNDQTLVVARLGAGRGDPGFAPEAASAAIPACCAYVGAGAAASKGAGMPEIPPCAEIPRGETPPAAPYV